MDRMVAAPSLSRTSSLKVNPPFGDLTRHDCGSLESGSILRRSSPHSRLFSCVRQKSLKSNDD